MAQLLKRYQVIATTAVLLASAATTSARLGETEAQLVARLGRVELRSTHYITAQGQVLALGAALFFTKDGWRVECDMIGGRCGRVAYTKQGEWTEDQIQLLLRNNSEGQQWKENPNIDPKKLLRGWTRSDGGSGDWKFIGTMVMNSAACERAKKAREEQARADARRLPKL